MLLPKALKKGDTIGIIAPASPPNMKRLGKAIPFFTNFGLRVKVGKNIAKVSGYLAGTDEERLADFHEMIADEEVKAIIIARGGYGTPRLASSLNYDLIASHPKVIWGYSDITYLHVAIQQKAGLVTFHGPMPASDLASPDIEERTLASFSQLLRPTSLQYSENLSSLEVLRVGEASGKLVGGNLTLLTSTLGTPFEVDTAGKILFIEDVNESPYRIDSMLNQLKLSGKLAQAAGVAIGSFTQIKANSTSSYTLDEIFHHYLSDLPLPVMSGFEIGHCSPNIGIPLGVPATMNTQTKTLSMMPGVIEN
ncbi:S66 peptidase family protein [Oceanobacillus alkalisoli]|uniref:S66 peptidase family protein n=1 Tax=Oceanobacillus alkalisoli TaxID=2925113 RepID=UPI001F121C25|nr:LD-carboxypeptidase [Oceanobacillus alkalisoli]MCF3943775.1 LD-carboxypeptidase [Oceanobacillus alkalisoli]